MPSQEKETDGRAKKLSPEKAVIWRKILTESTISFEHIQLRRLQTLECFIINSAEKDADNTFSWEDTQLLAHSAEKIFIWEEKVQKSVHSAILIADSTSSLKPCKRLNSQHKKIINWVAAGQEPVPSCCNDKILWSSSKCNRQCPLLNIFLLLAMSAA